MRGKLVVLVACLALTGCVGTIRSFLSKAALGGEGELFTTILCPLVSEAGNLVAAVPQRGSDESLWHLVEVVINPILGCAVGETEQLLLMPGVIPLDGKHVAKWMPGDRVTLTIANVANPRAPMPRSMHRAFSRRSDTLSSVASGFALDLGEPELATSKPPRVVVRANRRNSI